MTYVTAAAQAQRRPLTPDERNQWNSYLDFLQTKGMKGSPALDNRDTGLSQQLFNQYKTQNPHFSLTYDRVPDVQNDLQTYRQGLVNQWTANPSVAPDVKKPDDIMAGLSPVDGWLGSKTSSWKYPGAAIKLSNGSVVNYGTDTGAYDAAIANLKNK